MHLSTFFQTFYLCFVVLITVGPVFITTANIALTRGYLAGLCAILGCILGDAIFITLGALCAKAVIEIIPHTITMCLSLFAGCFLLYIAYNFWKSDVSKIKAKKINKHSIFLILKMLYLTLSSPLSIIGYSAIFSSIIDSQDSILSVIIGGICASIFTHNLIVGFFAFIGKKINTKMLEFLNKISAGLISFFAIIMIFGFFKELIKLI